MPYASPMSEVVARVPLLALIATLQTTACAGSLPLDPAFAPHAEELPTTVRSGFWPNAPVVMGTSSFTNVVFRRKDAAELQLPGVRLQRGRDGFRLEHDRTEAGVSKNHVVCDGGSTEEDARVEAVRCVADGPSGGFVLVASSASLGSPFTGTVAEPSGQALWTLERAPLPAGTGASGNVTGYVLRRGERIEATLDVTYRGRPKTWLARELGEGDRAAALGVLATVYFLGGKTDPR